VRFGCGFGTVAKRKVDENCAPPGPGIGKFKKSESARREPPDGLRQRLGVKKSARVSGSAVDTGDGNDGGSCE